MSDNVKRLGAFARFPRTTTEEAAMLHDAADEIERLRTERDSAFAAAREQAAKIVDGRQIGDSPYIEWPECGEGNSATDSILVAHSQRLAAAIRDMQPEAQGNEPKEVT